MDLTAVRGSRDFLPSEKILRNSAVAKLSSVFESYGFNPLETPALENIEVLSSKFAGGEEILKETYQLEDQGKRKLGLRYDLTVPLARLIAGNSFPMPFKRYAIDKVWRDGPLKAGRYREFVQCDVDVLGVKSVSAEAELMALAQDAFRKLGLSVVVKVNSRKLLNGVLQKAGVSKDKEASFILSLDKLEKIGVSGVKKELVDKGFSEKIVVNALKLLESKKLSDYSKIGNADAEAGFNELKEFFEFLNEFNVKIVEFSPTLARGLNYYTGIVFEAFLKDSEIKSSIAAGGRYDELIGKFSGRGEVPAVGISFGLDVLCEELKKTESKQSVVNVLVIPFKTLPQAIALTQTLRSNGVNALVDLNEKGVSKNLDFASKQGISFVIFCGEQELKSGKFKVRDMSSGKEELLSEKDLVKVLK
ncbi:histidine--tRNA ligase [Candidatus Micrarchaeota archaeon]|nr:histidine--tRNA ligase [Candidatus Micrarchaeota archaeon]